MEKNFKADIENAMRHAVDDLLKLDIKIRNYNSFLQDKNVTGHDRINFDALKGMVIEDDALKGKFLTHLKLWVEDRARCTRDPLVCKPETQRDGVLGGGWFGRLCI